MGKFKPGADDRRNTKGRPPGIANKTSDQIRELVRGFLSENISDLQTQYDKLEPKDKMTFFDRLLKHVLPAPLHELDRLTDDQLEELIKRIKDGKYNHLIN